MTESTSSLTCVNHPGVETSLRCNSCDRPICYKCAVRTPIGYRCKDCVRGQQKVFESHFTNAAWYDYLIAFFVPAFLSLLASILISMLSSFVWGFLVLLVAPAIGIGIARLTQLALRRRRSRTLFWIIPLGMLLGALPVVLFLVLSGTWFPLIWVAVYLVMATPIVYNRISGIHLR